MKPFPNRICDSNGYLRNAGTHGCGFCIEPMGDSAGAFPLDVRFEGNPKHEVMTILGPKTYQLGREGFFTGLHIENGTPNGMYLVTILDSPDEDYSAGESNIVGTEPAILGPSGAATQARLAAANGVNAPVLATDGASLGGARSIQLVIQAPAGRTLKAGGYAQAWHYDPNIALWVPLYSEQYAVNGGNRTEGSNDFDIGVSYGRYYWELVGVDDDNSTGTLIANGRASQR